LTQATQIPMSSGDEGGTAHPTIKGGSMYTMGNPVVFIEGMPAINLACPSTSNNMNDALGAALVPSVTTVTYCDASRITSHLLCERSAWARLSAHGLALAWASDPRQLCPTVVHVRRGSLGFRLGARAGDLLVAVQGRPVAELSPDEVLDLLEQRPIGTFQVLVARADMGAHLALACQPSDEDTRVLAAELLPGAVGLLSVRAFTAELPSLACGALDGLAQGGAASS